MNFIKKSCPTAIWKEGEAISDMQEKGSNIQKMKKQMLKNKDMSWQNHLDMPWMKIQMTRLLLKTQQKEKWML